MGYSRQEYVFEGGPQLFPVNFSLGVLDRSSVTVHVVGEIERIWKDAYGDNWRRAALKR